jgi:hypothetical protein
LFIVITPKLNRNAARGQSIFTVVFAAQVDVHHASANDHRANKHCQHHERHLAADF